MRITTLGPNLPAAQQRQGTFHVHAADCGDLHRRHYNRCESDTREFTSIRELVLDIYPPSQFDFDPDSPSDYATYRQDVKVFPCCRLPESSTAVA